MSASACSCARRKVVSMPSSHDRADCEPVCLSQSEQEVIVMRVNKSRRGVESPFPGLQSVD